MRGGDSVLTIKLSGRPNFSIEFKRTRWHRFTQLHSCKHQWIEQAYFRVVEIDAAEALNQFLAADASSIRAYKKLHHYRIFLDETGCHEVFAESAHGLSS
jgi:hypothetical protein